MDLQTRRINLETRGHADIIDITPQVQEELGKSGLVEGTVTVFVIGSTGALSTVEFEPGLVDDLKTLFEKVAPEGAEYQHELRWHDGNGHSHVRATLLGPSLSVPFVEAELILGTWQQIVFIDFDVRARTREIVTQFMGK